jgi:hypothetical protein
MKKNLSLSYQALKMSRNGTTMQNTCILQHFMGTELLSHHLQLSINFAVAALAKACYLSEGYCEAKNEPQQAEQIIIQ